MSRRKTRRSSGGGCGRLNLLPMLTIFAAGLGGGAFLRNILYGQSSTMVTTTSSRSDKDCVTETPLTDRMTTTTTTAADSNNNHNKEVHLCEENPYRQSLLDGATFESAERKAQSWMANKTAIRDAMYFKSYGKYTHDKFDAFEVMAPCNYKCTGECRADDSKIVCGTETLQQGCIIYSIGGNNEWEFEEKIYEMTPCEIHTFDCTGPISRFRPPPRIKDRHHFHHVCLATVNIPAVEHPERVKHVPPDFSVVGAMETLQRMQERLGHTRLDLLKLDIEGFEWPIFESWPELSDVEKSSKVALPMQILVEVHYRTAMHDLWPQKGVIFKDEVDIVELQAHLLRMGYVVAVRDDNELCRHCTELTLLRHKCV